MNFSLRHFLGFIAIICLALALTQISPIFGFAFLVIGIGGAFFLLETTTWRFFVCCALFGIAIYTIAFIAITEFLAPPETTTASKAVTEHQTWIESAKPLQHHTSIPIGALLGLTVGIAYLDLRRFCNNPIKSVHRYLVYAAFIISTIGIVGAVDYSIVHFYMSGKLLVFEFAGNISARYPPNPERLLAIHLTNNYFAISYPLLTGVVILLIGASIYAAKRNQRLVETEQ